MAISEILPDSLKRRPVAWDRPGRSPGEPEFAIFHHGFHKSSHRYIAATMMRLAFVTGMMLATWQLTDMITVNGIFGIIAKLVLSLVITVAVFALIYCRNKYVKQSVKAVRRFIFKREK